MIKVPEVKGKIFFNKELAQYTWFNVGGKADVVFEPYDIEDLQHFLNDIDKNILINIIGGGSNLLIRDGGINGVVIVLKNNFKNVYLENDILVAECGALNSKIFNFAKNNSIDNFTFLGTIPGTIGGAIRGNAGCYGKEIKDILISVDAIDFNGNLRTYTAEECNFEYRKNNLPENLIFVKAKFKTTKNMSKADIEKTFKEMQEKRLNSQPHGVKTAGSTFKNLPDKPAWKVVQELGYQNKEINGAKMSEKHANFMVNTGTAKAKDLENLGKSIIKDAKDKLGLNLEWEVKIIGKEL